MKTLIVAMCTVFVAIFVIGCSTSAEKAEHQKTVDAIVNNSLHIKDPVTGLCYKYFWGGSYYHGGPALATIPCEVVPADKLVTGKLKVK